MQVKIQYRKEIHLYKGKATIEALKDYVKTHFKKIEKSEFSLGYLDEEDDFITVSCDEDLGALQEMSKTPKLIVQPEEQQTEEKKPQEKQEEKKPHEKQEEKKPHEKQEQKQPNQNVGGIFGLFQGLQGMNGQQNQQQCPLINDVFKNLQESGIVENIVQGMFKPQNQNQNQESQQQDQSDPRERMQQNPLSGLFGAFMPQNQQNQQQDPLSGLLGAFQNFAPQNQEQQEQFQQNTQEFADDILPDLTGMSQQTQEKSEEQDKEPKEKIFAKEFSEECKLRANQVSEIMGGFADEYLGVCDAYSERDLDYIIERLIIDPELVNRLSSYKK